jgi:hypothetical protein
MAVSRLAPQPVALYAAVFFLVNVTYIALIWELLEATAAGTVPARVRNVMRFRALITLVLFAVAVIVALKFPVTGFGICVCCLVVYLRPDPPGTDAETVYTD